jgi:hypothetical protein
MIVKLTNWRIAFPVLHVPERLATDPAAKPAYSCIFLAPPGHPDLPVVEARVEEAGNTFFKDKWPNVRKFAEPQNKICLRSGDTKEYEGFPGNLMLSARTSADKGKPFVIDERGQVIGPEVDKVKGGDFVDASIQIYAYDNLSKGIGAAIRWVQFRRLSDRFSGSTPVSPDEWEDISVQNEAEDFA